MGTIQWMSFPRKNVLDAIQRIASDDFFDAIEISHFANDDERRRAKEMLEQAHASRRLDAGLLRSQRTMQRMGISVSCVGIQPTA